MAALATYSYSQPMMNYARYVGVTDENAAGYAERAETIYYYVTERPDIIQNANYLDSQRWWTRFEFAAKQAFAMNLRDNGVTSQSLAQLPTVFIPRIFWPNKPELRSPGQDFYYLVSGRTTTRMSISVYADLYWQFGWVGVILGSPLIGIGLALMTNKLLPHIRARDFAYFPLVLIGVRYALVDPNKYVINGVLSTAAFFILYAVAIQFAVRVVSESFRDSASKHASQVH
ncbi:hypothetical protein GCM10011515_23550 [Tsuneonella deserti]|uniref:Uncharacterized protein n=2 Tax=Tsuneonella deserti TaxID=2035528 RepID=A0ABQ1SBY8_9SPHN|nr:hypothetical protein GCM10011515_23550 [Tsuneonella deserti]